MCSLKVKSTESFFKSITGPYLIQLRHLHSVTEGGGGGHGGHPHLPQRDRAPPRRPRGLRRWSPCLLLHRHVLAQEGFKAEF